MKYTCSMETVQQNGRFTLFSSKFPSKIYSILFGKTSVPILHLSILLVIINLVNKHMSPDYIILICSELGKIPQNHQLNTDLLSVFFQFAKLLHFFLRILASTCIVAYFSICKLPQLHGCIAWKRTLFYEKWEVLFECIIRFGFNRRFLTFIADTVHYTVQCTCYNANSWLT